MGRPDHKSVTPRRLAALNNERFTHTISCLVGQHVKILMKDDSKVEGIFHSCETSGWLKREDKPMDIVLKQARHILPPTENINSSNNNIHAGTMKTFVVPANQYVSIIAETVPSTLTGDDGKGGRGIFQTDTEISSGKQGQPGQERKLEKWIGDNGKQNYKEALMNLEQYPNKEPWDQFEVNEKKFGVQTTYDDELYTTKLDISSIPSHIQEHADKIAKELEHRSHERGYKESDNGVEYDEEALFSAVTRDTPPAATNGGGGGGGGGKQGGRTMDKQGKASNKVFTSKTSKNSFKGGSSEHNDSNNTSTGSHQNIDKQKHSNDLSHNILRQKGDGGGHNLPSATDGSSPTFVSANPPYASNTNPELKDINALNLEPVLPKLNESTRNEWYNCKQYQTLVLKGAANHVSRRQEKQQFLKALQVIKDKMNRIGIKTSDSDNHGNTRNSGVDEPASTVTAGHHSPGFRSASTTGMGSTKGRNFQFNPNANTFTPSNATGNSGGAAAIGTNLNFQGTTPSQRNPGYAFTNQYHPHSGNGIPPSASGNNTTANTYPTSPMGNHVPNGSWRANNGVLPHHHIPQGAPPDACGPGGVPLAQSSYYSGQVQRYHNPNTPFVSFRTNLPNKNKRLIDTVLDLARNVAENPTEASHEWASSTSPGYRECLNEDSLLAGSQQDGTETSGTDTDKQRHGCAPGSSCCKAGENLMSFQGGVSRPDTQQMNNGPHHGPPGPHANIQNIQHYAQMYGNENLVPVQHGPPVVHTGQLMPIHNPTGMHNETVGALRPAPNPHIHHYSLGTGGGQQNVHPAPNVLGHYQPRLPQQPGCNGNNGPNSRPPKGQIPNYQAGQRQQHYSNGPAPSFNPSREACMSSPDGSHPDIEQTGGDTATLVPGFNQAAQQNTPRSNLADGGVTDNLQQYTHGNQPNHHGNAQPHSFQPNTAQQGSYHVESIPHRYLHSGGIPSTVPPTHSILQHPHRPPLRQISSHGHGGDQTHSLQPPQQYRQVHHMPPVQHHPTLVEPTVDGEEPIPGYNGGQQNHEQQSTSKTIDQATVNNTSTRCLSPSNNNNNNNNNNNKTTSRHQGANRRNGNEENKVGN